MSGFCGVVVKGSLHVGKAVARMRFFGRKAWRHAGLAAVPACAQTAGWAAA